MIHLEVIDFGSVVPLGLPSAGDKPLIGSN